jgi:hypothetical protein
MALTRKEEQRLERAKLTEFFENNRDQWKLLAQHAYDYVMGNFPVGTTIRRDDVAEALTPILEVNESLIDSLDEKSLKQKYWYAYFCDFILDQTWNEITQPSQPL